MNNRKGGLFYQAEFIRSARDYQFFEGIFFHHLFKFGIEHIKRYGAFRPSRAQIEFYLAFGGKRVYHARNRADVIQRVETIYCLRNIRQAHGDLVTFFYADCRKRLCRCFYVLFKERIGNYSSHI